MFIGNYKLSIKSQHKPTFILYTEDSRVLQEFSKFFRAITKGYMHAGVTTCWQLDFHVLTDKQTG